MLKRFYKEASAVAADDGFLVHLDGRPLRTPGRSFLRLPTMRLAGEVASEWAVQGQEIVPADMPMMRLATTVIDLLPTRRNDALAEIAGYAETDLLSYRATEPRGLVERQAAVWEHWLAWSAEELAAPLRSTQGITPVEQPPAALQALRAAAAALDDWRLVGLHAAVSLTGSIVLSLAIERGRLPAREAFAIAALDELYEIERWGEEEEQAHRHRRLRDELVALDRYFAALG